MRLSYSYDAWGQCEIEYVNGGEFCTARKNRLAYRGYYYDTDLGLYYLQSRYYDANTCRFINADSYISTGQGILGYNMYAYCGNNPVNRVDPTGEAWWYWLCYAVSPVVTTVLATANDIYQIASGAVKPLENDEQDSVQIQNSNKILTPFAQTAIAIYTDYIKPETKDLINGSVYGVVFEWTLHNIAYDALTFLGVKGNLVESAAHVDVGSTIYSDNTHKNASKAMHIFYTASFIFNPKSVMFDIVTHVFRRK